MTTPTSISVSGLSKRYRIGPTRGYKTLRDSLSTRVRRAVDGKTNGASETIWALKDVGFEVSEGDVLGLIGRNGAGKSTLLKLLARITEPTEGRIELLGRVGSMLEVGTGFHPELSGRENIFLNGSILGMRKREIQARFDEIVAFAEIDEFLDTPVKRYSSGMYVRLAFAVAAHLDPEILLIDEVLAVGDAAFQQKCLGKMSDVARHGRTVIFVSHNMAAIQQLTRTGLWIDAGRVAALGPTSDVVQSYLSSIQSNAGTVAEIDDSMRPFAELRRVIEFERVELEGRSSSLVPADEDIDLLIDVRAMQAARDFRFSVTLRRLDGVAVGNVFGESTLSLAAGDRARYRLRLTDLRLAPGVYQISLGAGTGDHSTERREFDVVRDVLTFECLNDADGIAGEWHADWGSIRFSTPEVSRVS